ncbi:MAG: ABC transporter substrate-binding protein, partial [Alkalispirochaeta sp.]
MTASVLTGCSPRPIVVGFQGPLTGTAADLGVQGRNGALLAVEAINAAGGVGGRALQLAPRDDRNDRAVAIELVQEFRDERIEVVVGPMTSVAGVAVAERVSQAGPLYISPTVSTAEVSDRDDFFFRIQGATDRPAWVLGRFAAAELGTERVAVVADRDNAEYSQTYLEAFSRGVAAAGGEVASAET